MVEAPAEPKKGPAAVVGRGMARSERRPQPLREIDYSQDARISLGLGEVDRILGGGMVPAHHTSPSPNTMIRHERNHPSGI